MSDTPPPLSPASEPTPPPSSGLSPRNWCTFIHVSPLIGVWLGVGHIIVPLILWLVKKDSSAEVDVAGRNVLNFQISYTIYFLVSLLLCTLFIGFILVPIVALVWLILIIVGTIKSGNGENYIYPLCIRFL